MRTYTNFGELLTTGNQGTQGPQGTPGSPGGLPGGYILSYEFSATTNATGIAAGQVRLNDSVAVNVTKMWVHDTDRNAEDMDEALDVIPAGSFIRLFADGDSTLYADFRLTALPTDQGTYHELDVEHIGGSNLPADTDPTSIGVGPAGNQGPQGFQGNQGNQGAGVQGAIGPSGGFEFRFDYPSASGAPSSGEIRYNAGGDHLFIHETNKDGGDLTEWWNLIAVGDALKIRSVTNPNDWIAFGIAAINDAGTYRDITWTLLGFSNPPAQDAEVMLSWDRKGATGSTGSQGEVGGYTQEFTFAGTTTTPALGEASIDALGTTLRLSVETEDGLNVQALNLSIPVQSKIKVFKLDGTAVRFYTFTTSGFGSGGSGHVFYFVTADASFGTFNIGDPIGVSFAMRGSAGTQGAQGPQGPQGFQGFQGFQGVQGTTGTQGGQGQLGGFTVEYNFNSAIDPAAPPSSGQLRFDEANFADIEKIYFHRTNALGGDMNTFFETLKVGDLIKVFKKTDPSAYILFYIGSPVDVDGSLTTVSGQTTSVNGSFSNGDPLGVGFAPIGSQGTQGGQGNQGSPGGQGPQGLQGAQGPQGVGYLLAAGPTSHTHTLGLHTFTNTFHPDTLAAINPNTTAFEVGMRVRVVAVIDSFMEGTITSMSASSVTVAVDLTKNSDGLTYTHWNFSVAGERGAQGAQGESGGFNEGSIEECLLQKGATTLIADDTFTQVLWGIEHRDTNNFRSPGSTGDITINTAGFYIVNAMIMWGANFANGYRWCEVRINGNVQTNLLSIVREASVAGNHQVVTGVVKVSAGDVIQVWVRQKSGAGLLVIGETTLAVVSMVGVGPQGASSPDADAPWASKLMLMGG